MINLIDYLTELLDYLEYANRMSPFPQYDTEYVKLVREGLNDMKKGKNKYDEAPVTACKYCNNLFIIVDELENDICTRCGSENELKIYKDIFEYLKTTGHNEDN